MTTDQSYRARAHRHDVQRWFNMMNRKNMLEVQIYRVNCSRRPCLLLASLAPTSPVIVAPTSNSSAFRAGADALRDTPSAGGVDGPQEGYAGGEEATSGAFVSTMLFLTYFSNGGLNILIFRDVFTTPARCFRSIGRVLPIVGASHPN